MNIFEKWARRLVGAPKGQPCCGCIELFENDTDEAYWAVEHCDCGNYDDRGEASDWCARENSVKRVAYALEKAYDGEIDYEATST